MNDDLRIVPINSVEQHRHTGNHAINIHVKNNNILDAAFILLSKSIQWNDEVSYGCVSPHTSETTMFKSLNVIKHVQKLFQQQTCGPIIRLTF